MFAPEDDPPAVCEEATNPDNRGRAFRRSLVAAGLAVVLLGAGLLAARPAVFAQVGGWLPRFGQQQRAGMVLLSPTEVARLSHPPPSPPPGVARPQPGPGRMMTPDLTLEEAQQQAPHHIPVPAWLPPGVVFRGALVSPAQDVVVSYRSADDLMKGMGLQIKPGSPGGGYAFPASAAEDTQVDGQPAVYVHGTWHPNQQWDATADAGTLSWQQRGFTYLLFSSGLGLSRDDLVRIAQSLR